MFWQFSGCTDSTVIISLTLCLSVLATILQLFASEVGSVLTSGIVTSYATYVCYSAVTLNPDSACNPTLQTGYQTLSTVSCNAVDLYLQQLTKMVYSLLDHRLSAHCDLATVDHLQLK